MDSQLQAFSNELLLLDQMGEIPILDAREERALLIQAQNGDKTARNRLVQCNLKLILKKAQSLHKKYVSVSLLDLFQEGVIGFMNAIDKFDINYDTRLTTYANKAIEQSISRAFFDKYSPLRITEKWRMEYEKLEKKGLLNDSNSLRAEISYLKQINFKSVTYLDNHIGSDASLTIADTLEDKNDDYEALQQDLDLRYLRYSLQENLSNYQYYILYHRVLSPQKKTLEQLAHELHITVEGVRRAQSNIINKIRKKYVDGSTSTLNLTCSVPTKDLPPFEPLHLFYHVSFYALGKVVDEITYTIIYWIYVKKRQMESIIAKTQLSLSEISQMVERVKQQYPWFLNPNDPLYQQLEEELTKQRSVREIINQNMDPQILFSSEKQITKARKSISK